MKKKLNHLKVSKESHKLNWEQRRERATKSMKFEDVVPIPLFPPRPKVVKKDDGQFIRFIELLKKVKVNIPLLDLLINTTKYAKFIKEVIANKEKF